MAYQLYLNKKNITDLVGNIAWESNVDTLGVKLEFDIAYTDMKEMPKVSVLPGDIITFRNGKKVIFKGIVVTDKVNGRSPKHFICFDFAFYLNKSKTVIQFNKHVASSAIKKVLDEFNISSKIVSIPTTISAIYKDKVISDIIKDILNQASKETGDKYRMEMRGNVLYIEKQRNLVIKANVNLISNPSRTRSIEEMKNSIKIVSDGEKSSKIVAVAKDNKNIKKFGLLQEVQTVDKKDKAKAQNIANKLLKELNIVKEDNSIELLGNDDTRSGRILAINEPITGIVGKYLITDCKQTLNNGIRKMSLTLGVA